MSNETIAPDRHAIQGGKSRNHRARPTFTTEKARKKIVASRKTLLFSDSKEIRAIVQFFHPLPEPHRQFPAPSSTAIWYPLETNMAQDPNRKALP